MSRNLIATNPFGEIQPPAALESGFGVIGGSGPGGGPTGLISNLIIIITMIAGIWTLFNILFAGFTVITAEGDPKKIGEMTEKIRNTFIGLLIMVGAPLITAIISLFFFGDATTLLQPTLFGPGP